MEKPKMKLYEARNECCGCSGCFNACNFDALHMVPDKRNILFPEIDYERCVTCRKCEKVCEFQRYFQRRTKDDLEGENRKHVYVAVNRDRNQMMKSASGGIFAALAQNVLDAGGVVFGSAMNRHEDGLKVEHIAVEDPEDLRRLQGSKYAESDIGETYKMAKRYLRQGRTVLFSGTPCQIAGLRSFLNCKNHDGLITVDIICHGVPSGRVFTDYIRTVERKQGITVQDFIFRDKTKGENYTARMEYLKNGQLHSELITSTKSSYYRMFLKALIFRENCYACPYAGENRPADLTLGDFWGVEKEHPDYLVTGGGEIEPGKGVSYLIVNTERGEEAVQRFGQKILKHESSFEQAARANAQLRHPSHRPAQREILLDAYAEGGFEEMERRYKKMMGYKYWIIRAYAGLPGWTKNLLKKVRK